MKSSGGIIPLPIPAIWYEKAGGRIGHPSGVLVKHIDKTAIDGASSE